MEDEISHMNPKRPYEHGSLCEIEGGRGQKSKKDDISNNIVS